MKIARYTQKQIDKYQRQKYISELEKMSKNLFRMFRDTGIDAEVFLIKFKRLKKRLDEHETVLLDSEYHKQLKAYIERLYALSCLSETFGDEVLNNIREAEMSNLNRLQKLKKENSYKKEKHKGKREHDGWE